MATAASPWKTSVSAMGTGASEEPIVSFAEIMSEELAHNLQMQEEAEAQPKTALHLADSSTTLDGQQQEIESKESEADCSNDFLLAMMIQNNFDKEHDMKLKLEEAKYNKNEKVRVSFERYKTLDPWEDSESSEDEDDDCRETRHHKMDTKKAPSFGPSGLLRQPDGTLISKHDQTVSGRKNTAKVLEFPPEFQTGDAIGLDVQLPNNVYNELKRHSSAETHRRHRLHEKKEKSTNEMSVDANTRLVLFKLVNVGLLDSVNGAVSTGKEAVVFHAYGGGNYEARPGCREVPNECALKVFKTTLNEFKNRCEYVKDDYRFKNPRKILKIWAEKEMLNLNRMRRAGIRCPSVVKLKGHVLVMSFIGCDGAPAPKLKDVALDDEQLLQAYQECTEAMKCMYDRCRLVHADLSEFNVLYWKDHCYVIDVSQAVDTSHPRSLVFLARDCHNLTEFFSKRGLRDPPTRRELFNQITGLDMQSEQKFYAEVQEYQIENRALQRRKDKQNPADYALRKYQEEKQRENDATLSDTEDFD